MALIAKEGGGGTFESVTEGLHPATCIALIDLGDQYSEMYDKSSHKAILMFEVHDEAITIDGEDKPKWISKEYTLSLSEKANLRKDLESWRGRKFTKEELDGFDVKNILSKPCQIQVLHNEKKYANIASIVSWPKGMPAPEIKSELLYYEIHDEKAFAKIPEWIQKKIKESETWKSISDFAPIDDDTPDFLKPSEVY